MNQIYLALIFFLAGIVPELTGFGVATVSMSLVLFFLPPETAIPLIAIVSVIATGIIAVTIKTKGVLKRIAPLIAGSLIGVPLGMFFLNIVNWEILQIFISVFLIGYAGYGLLIKKIALLPQNKLSGGIIGAVAGFFSASFNIHGPLIGIYSSPGVEKSANTYKDMVASYMFVSGLFTVFGHLVSGRITEETLTPLIYIVPALVCGLYVGSKLFNRVKGDFIKKFVYIFVLIAGIALLLK